VITVRCPAESDTIAFARRLAAALRPGDVILLSGSLGSGKTLFTSGLASGLGVEEAVVSPSFVLVREYRSGFMPLVHADVYRLESLNEFDDLDVFELAAKGALVIEWGDAIEGAVPAGHLEIDFAVEPDGARVLTIAHDNAWADRSLEELL
jgi:tRNA threonylcarbamoyladenosine biosynthesis protein TsaE